EKYGEYVVITNVVDTIGFEFAKAFAKQGHSLVLIATKSEQLEKVKHALEKCLHTDKKIVILTYDEKQPEEENFSSFEKALTEVKDKIGILVNNCTIRFKSGDNFLEYSRSEILDLMYADIGNPLLITRIIVPIMAENKRGLILNVTIPNNFRPVEHKGFPHVMREFVDFFGTLIKKECESYNIKVQTLNPGWIEKGRKGSKRFPSFLVQTPTSFVESVMPSVGTTDKTTGFWLHTVFGRIIMHTPDFIHKCIYYLYRAVNGAYDDLNQTEEGEQLISDLEHLIKQNECEPENKSDNP
ncbi:uncharacterized protein B4U80_11970, partial [Leptotrombidium deliense]